MLTSVSKRSMICPLMVIGDRAETGDIGCSTDGCMMWRFAEPLTRRNHLCRPIDSTIEPQRPAFIPASWEFCPFDPGDGDPASWVQPEADARAERKGYCGLAGKPEISF